MEGQTHTHTHKDSRANSTEIKNKNLDENKKMELIQVHWHWEHRSSFSEMTKKISFLLFILLSSAKDTKNLCQRTNVCFSSEEKANRCFHI